MNGDLSSNTPYRENYVSSNAYASNSFASTGLPSKSPNGDEAIGFGKGFLNMIIPPSEAADHP